MINIVDKNSCCGCTACYSICPQNCINMVQDSEGFLYPEIELEKCIQCNKCERVCPLLGNRIKSEEKLKKGYVARNKDKKQLDSCSSGGFVYSVLYFLSQQGYYICGASFDEDFNVHHTIIPPNGDINIFSSSKYVQSDLGTTFKDLKKLVQNGKKVCFVGTGCQVDGLISFLGKHYENLVTIDVVCHGVPSRLIWQKYKEHLESKYNSKICNVNFRDKSLGYQTPCIRIDFENGKKYLHTGRTDIMLKSFFSHASLRMSCFNCASKGLNRVSDLTVFDCWNSSELIGIDDNRGFTAVIAHSDIGNEIVLGVQNICSVFEIPVDKLIPAGGGGMVMNSAKYNPIRENYFDDIYHMGLNKAFISSFNITKLDYIVEELKICLAKIGALQNISRKRRLKNKYK